MPSPIIFVYLFFWHLMYEKITFIKRVNLFKVAKKKKNNVNTYLNPIHRKRAICDFQRIVLTEY